MRIKKEVRCIPECTKFTPKQILDGECPHTQYHGPLEETTKKQSKIDKDVAPENMENLFFLVPVAPDLDDSDSIREAYFDKVLEKFENETGEKIKDDIVVKSLFTHRDFKERYNAYKGTGLGMAHTLWQTAVFRPKHKSSKVNNLYYTGQYNHPGVGVPTTVISSQILVNELNKKGVLT